MAPTRTDPHATLIERSKNLSMAISASELETAACTFGAAFFGYLTSAGYALTSVVVEHAAITGAIAALGVLGYHVYQGNVSAPSAGGA